MKPLTIPLSTGITSLALIGGGEFSFGDTREVDEALVAALPADRKTVAFVPTASGSAEYAIHFGAYLKTIDPAVETINVPIYRGRDVRRQKSLALLGSAGMIYLGGGVLHQLLVTLRGTPAEQALREAAAAGVTVAAIGASAAAFGTWAWDSSRGVAAEGFGWLPGTVVEPAFDGGSDTSLRRLMSLPDARLGVGIPAGSAILVKADGSTTIAGSGQIATFRKAAQP